MSNQVFPQSENTPPSQPDPQPQQPATKPFATAPQNPVSESSPPVGTPSPQQVDTNQPYSQPQSPFPPQSQSLPPAQAAMGTQQPIGSDPNWQATPSINGAYLDKTPPGITIGVLAIVFGSVIPFVGIVLGIIAIVKGMRKNNGNKKLASLGFSAIILAIISAIVYVSFIVSANTYTLDSTYDSGVRAGKVGSYQFSLQRPDEFQEHNTSLAPNTTLLEDLLDEDTARSTALIIIEEDPGQKLYKQSTASKNRLQLEVNIEKFAEQYLNLDEASASNPRAVKTGVGNAIAYDLRGTAGTADARGVFVYTTDVKHDATYNIAIISESSLWESNAEVLTEMALSITAAP